MTTYGKTDENDILFLRSVYSFSAKSTTHNLSSCRKIVWQNTFMLYNRILTL